MPGWATPSASRLLPLVRPWSDSTRPIAAISCQERWQLLSAELMTVSARWYAASAAAGMPEVEAVATTVPGSPCTPGATPPEVETLAGALIAWVGTVEPSGRRSSGWVSALAVLAPTPAMLAVQAADSTASGTRAMAFWPRPNRAFDIVALPVPTTNACPSARAARSNERVTHRLRFGARRCLGPSFTGRPFPQVMTVKLVLLRSGRGPGHVRRARAAPSGRAGWAARGQ